MGRQLLVALTALSCLSTAAHAETVVVACDPDRIVDKTGSRTLNDAEKKAGVWRTVFAYDLASGKACIADRTIGACMTNHRVEADGNSGVKLTAMLYNRRMDLTLILASGRFSRSAGDQTFSGKDKACTPLAGLTVDLNKRPDPFD